MSGRYYHPAAGQEQRVLLAGDEGHHLATVMRARIGDEVTLFDGRGCEVVARVTGIGKRAVELEVVSQREVSRELPWPVTLAVALPKGERQKWLVEKATELGVRRLVPLGTQRGVAQPVAEAVARLQRVVIEASKQCGRNQLMDVDTAWPCTQFFQAESTSGLCLLADPGGRPLAEAAQPIRGPVCCAVGPEGGFTEAERQAALAAGWKAVSLGRRILRVETAAIALAAYVSLAQEGLPAAPVPDAPR
jgi:16S rRNA (uracil1498-N3)-methyltransferase